MTKYVKIMVLVASVAISVPLSAMQAERATSAAAQRPAEIVKQAPLDKTWTTGAPEKAAGSQMRAIAALTSLGSFEAEGSGFGACG
jgi:hypothetical protein